MNHSLLFILFISITASAQQPPEPEVAAAVARGKAYTSRDAFLSRGLQDKRIAISKTAQITFYDDSDVVAAAVAEANQKMRELSPEDLKQIPRSGLLFANVEIKAGRRGVGGRVSKSLDRYMDGAAHLVLKVGDTVIQPVEIGSYPTPPKSPCYQTMYLWSAFGTLNLTVGGFVPINLPCPSQQPDKISIEFAFRLSNEQWRPGEVILIDSSGARESAPVDLAKLR